MLEFLHKHNLTHPLITAAVCAVFSVFGLASGSAAVMAAYYFGREHAQFEILEDKNFIKAFPRSLVFWKWPGKYFRDFTYPLAVAVCVIAADVFL